MIRLCSDNHSYLACTGYLQSDLFCSLISACVQTGAWDDWTCRSQHRTRHIMPKYCVFVLFFPTQIHPWLKCLDLKSGLFQRTIDVYTQKHAWTIIKSWPYQRDVRPLRAAVKCVKCDGCSDRCFDLIFCSSRIWPVRGVGPSPPLRLLRDESQRCYPGAAPTTVSAWRQAHCPPTSAERW